MITSSDLREALAHIRGQAQARIADVAFNDFDSLAQEIGESFAMLGRELLEHRRFLHHAAETLRGQCLPYCAGSSR